MRDLWQLTGAVRFVVLVATACLAVAPAHAQTITAASDAHKKFLMLHLDFETTRPGRSRARTPCDSTASAGIVP